MVHASDLRPLSITGRYAYALACIERLCDAWDIADPFVQAEIDAHWQATEIKLACHWFDEHSFPRSPDEFRSRLRGETLSQDQVQALHHAFHEARMVCCGSCYAAGNEVQSMQSVLNVVGVLARWGWGCPRSAVSAMRLGRVTSAGLDGARGSVEILLLSEVQRRTNSWKNRLLRKAVGTLAGGGVSAGGNG